VFFIAFSTASASFAAPSIRDQAIGISKEVRDPGAVNQSLYESNAPQAAELKAKIYQLLENGQTREDILDYFAARYGKQIRYDPPVDPWTAALWVVPAALFSGLLLTALFLILRRKKENH
jgi:cytochrome c-type biogenesis protein CcmH/NrfF